MTTKTYDMRPSTHDSKKILVAPLNWGLGHATRCVPIIHQLLQEGKEVVLAASGNAYLFLKAEFPNLTMIDFPDYDIHYQKKERKVYWSVLFQSLKIVRGIKKEHQVLAQIVQNQGIDFIISDNRYGLYHPQVKSILMTHQLHIAAPFLSWIPNFFIQKFIQRFDECWVPDIDSEQNYAGKLSKNTAHLKNVKYIGLQSRFAIKNAPSLEDKEPLYDVCIIVSGPEPHRSGFEEKMIALFKNAPLKVCMVLGKPSSENHIKNENMDIYSHLSTDLLLEKIRLSKVVISRAGYSTIMDLIFLQKKAILIPTPGQTEQEYLSKYLDGKHQFKFVDEKDLGTILKDVTNF